VLDALAPLAAAEGATIGVSQFHQLLAHGQASRALASSSARQGAQMLWPGSTVYLPQREQSRSFTAAAARLLSYSSTGQVSRQPRGEPLRP